MVIFAETSRVLRLVRSPVRGNHSLLSAFNTWALADLACPSTSQIARAREPFPAVGVQHLCPGRPPVNIGARLPHGHTIRQGKFRSRRCHDISGDRRAGSFADSLPVGYPPGGGPEGPSTSGFPVRGRGDEEAGRRKVPRCVSRVHEELDGWPMSSVPPRGRYVAGAVVRGWSAAPGTGAPRSCPTGPGRRVVFARFRRQSQLTLRSPECYEQM